MPPIPDLSAIHTYPVLARSGASDNPVRPDSVLDQLPTVLRLGKPEYPRGAREKGLQGWAVIDAILGPDGRVEAGSLRLVAASDQIFVAPAERAVAAAEYVPGRVGGTAVRVLIRLPVMFRLAGRRPRCLPGQQRSRGVCWTETPSARED